MSEREDEVEVSVSVRNEEDVSPECLAWADSCISFPDDSENSNWGNFRDALTEIIDIHPEMFVPLSTTGTRSFSTPEDEEMTESVSIEPEADSGNGNNNNNNNNSSSNEEASEIISLLTFESDPSIQDHYFLESIAENGTIRTPVEATIDLDGVEGIEEEDGSVSDGEAEEELLASLLSQAVKDDYMSTYVQVDNDSNVLEDPFNLTPQEIFKVWDLEVTRDNDEEAEFVLQLNKALDVSSTVQSLPQPLNGDQVVAEKSSIDDLIAGISDLSLGETFK